MATSETAPMGRLEAVNVMLTAIGQVPIHSLLTAETNADAEQALALLTSTSREVQSRGYDWNIEKSLTLDPAPNGHVNLPENTLKVFTVHKDRHREHLVRRGLRLWDRREHTFAIGKPVKVDLVLHLPFEELPSSARWYITVKAARRFGTAKLHSMESFQFTSTDEQEAMADLLTDDAETDARTMAQANRHILNMRRGRR